MAIKASAIVTLTNITDVAVVTRYYLLQSSTLAYPDKPTTNPPDESWTTTEPSYTEESTDSLYFCDVTTYSDDTFSVSDVSLSSAYEAAKVAYNRAVAANDTATAALSKIAYATCSTSAGTTTKVASVQSGSFALTTGATVTVYFTYANTNSAPKLNVASTGAKAIRPNTGTGWSSDYNWAAKSMLTFTFTGTYWVFADGATSAIALANAKKYTDAQAIGGTNLIQASGLSYGTIDDSGALVENDDYVTSDYIYMWGGLDVILQTWRTSETISSLVHYVTFYDSEQTYLSGYSDTLYGTAHTIVQQAAPSTAAYMRATFPTEAEKYKLEVGTKPTDWSIAPEDIQAAIDNTASADDIDNLQNSIDAVVDNINDIQNTMDDKIVDVVTSQISATNDAFEVRFNNQQQKLNSLDTTLTETVANIDNWMSFDSSGELHIGATPEENEDKFELVLSKSSIDFNQNDNTVAYINNNKLMINESLILSKLQVGNFIWNTRVNGSMNLVWTDD